MHASSVVVSRENCLAKTDRLVHQSQYHLLFDGMSINDAIMEAARNRIRPIFMSTLTSVFGMLPLVVFPGAGSELYRGLGSVVVGGLAMSAIPAE